MTDTATRDLDAIDAADTTLADRADAVLDVRAAILEVQRELHQLGLDLLDAGTDYEATLAATYALTDASERLTSLRFRLELTLA